MQWWEGFAAPRFLVDVNGWKGPNQMGTDSFYFTLDEHTGSGELVTNGLKCGETYYNPAKYTNSSRDCNSYGYNCSCPIMYNGWKIPDNYPVKKF